MTTPLVQRQRETDLRQKGLDCPSAWGYVTKGGAVLYRYIQTPTSGNGWASLPWCTLLAITGTG